MGGSPFFSRYLSVIMSWRLGLITFLPNFFFTAVVSFFMIGFIALNSNGVAAAPAVANTAIATVVVDWLIEGRNFSAAPVGSYNVTQIVPCSSWPITLSSPDCVRSPTLRLPGPGHGVSTPRSPVGGTSGGSISGGGCTTGGGVSTCINTVSYTHLTLPTNREV